MDDLSDRISGLEEITEKMQKDVIIAKLPKVVVFPRSPVPLIVCPRCGVGPIIGVRDETSVATVVTIHSR